MNNKSYIVFFLGCVAQACIAPHSPRPQACSDSMYRPHFVINCNTADPPPFTWILLTTLHIWTSLTQHNNNPPIHYSKVALPKTTLPGSKIFSLEQRPPSHFTPSPSSFSTTESRWKCSGLKLTTGLISSSVLRIKSKLVCSCDMCYREVKTGLVHWRVKFVFFATDIILFKSTMPSTRPRDEPGAAGPAALVWINTMYGRVEDPVHPLGDPSVHTRREEESLPRSCPPLSSGLENFYRPSIWLSQIFRLLLPPQRKYRAESSMCRITMVYISSLSVFFTPLVSLKTYCAPFC